MGKAKIQYNFVVNVSRNIQPGKSTVEKFCETYSCCKECLVQSMCLVVKEYTIADVEKIEINRPCEKFIELVNTRRWRAKNG